MPDPTNTTTQPALDMKAIAEATTAAVAAALKPMTDTMSKLTESIAAIAAHPQKHAESGAGDPKPGKDAPAALTLEAVSKLITDGIAASRKADESTAEVGAAVKSAAEKHLAGVPAVYHGLLPQTKDAAALETKAKEIRDQFQKDLAAAGVKAPNVGTTPGAHTAPVGGSIDMSKINPVRAIAEGYATKK